ncbi:MAG: DUF6089 family protein [Bacteroidota bacterium]
MRKKLSVFTLLLLFPFFVFSQNFEGGFSFGLMTYQGDLAESFVELREANLAYAFVLRNAISDRFYLRVGFMGGQISGDDANASSAGLQMRGFSFRSDLYEFHLLGEWNILGEGRASTRGGVERQRFTPYLFLGVGAVLFDPQVFDGQEKDPEGRDYSTFNVSVPIGGGIKFGLNDRVVLSLEAGGRTAFSDYLDGISQLGNPDRNDWYFAGNLILTYTFGSPNIL